MGEGSGIKVGRGGEQAEGVDLAEAGGLLKTANTVPD